MFSSPPQQRGTALAATAHTPEAPPAPSCSSGPSATTTTPRSDSPPCYASRSGLTLLQTAGFPLAGQQTSVGTTDTGTISKPALHSIARAQ